jgi:SAM-dependent methyltransferase
MTGGAIVSEFDAYFLRYEDEINQAISFCGKSHDFYTRVKADVLIELLLHDAPERTLDLLDVGCGTGALHPFLLASGVAAKVTGIEVAAQYVEMARQVNPDVNYDVYDGRRLPYDAGRFDSAFTICVMHHVPPAQWSEFLAEMCRVVRPGGLLAVFEHNPFNPITARIVRTCPIDRNAVLLKPAYLGKLMRAAGLDAVRHEYILFTPFASKLFRRFDRRLSWLPLGAQYVSFGRVPRPRSTSGES